MPPSKRLKPATSTFLSTTDYFGRADFSDITIKFSERAVECHKIILCSRSQYFEKLCGPNSKFAESKARAVELKDDDPDAVEAVLRYIYTGEETPASNENWLRQEDWLHHLEVSKAATKYLLSDLEVAAFDQFQAACRELKNSSTVLHAITIIREKGDQQKHFNVADELEEKHRSALLRHDDYRKLVQEDEASIWRHMDRFNHAEDMKEVEMVKCSRCGGSFARLSRCNSGLKVRCWVSQKEVEAVYGTLQ